MNVATRKVIDPPSWLVVFTTSLVGFWLLGNLLRVTLPFGGSIYPHDVLLALLCVFNLPSVLDLTTQALRYVQKNAVVSLLLVWIGVGWVIGGANGAQAFTGMAYAARLVLYVCGLQILITHWRINPLPIHKGDQDLFISLPIFLTTLVVFFSSLGILQYIFLPDTRFLASLGWDDHYYRLLSTQLDPNFAGSIIVLGILAVTALKNSFWKYLSFGVLGLSLLLTWSRASWLALGIGILWLAAKKSPRKVALTLLGLVGLILIVWLIPKPSGEGGNLLRTSTITSRYESTLAWFGNLQPYEWAVGRGLFVPTQTTESSVINNARLPDSWLVTVLSGIGVIGTVLVVLAIFQNRSYWNKLEPYSQAAVVAILVHGLFNNTVTQPFVFLGLATLLITQLRMRTLP